MTTELRNTDHPSAPSSSVPSGFLPTGSTQNCRTAEGKLPTRNQEELVTETTEMHRSDPTVDLDVDLSHEIECECMVCDLPIGDKHEPVEWRVRLHFPGPYPGPCPAKVDTRLMVRRPGRA